VTSTDLDPPPLLPGVPPLRWEPNGPPPIATPGPGPRIIEHGTLLGWLIANEGRWVSFDLPGTTSNAGTVASRLRDRGCEATSRGTRVYARWVTA
jgi:hypothetical protein